MLEGVFEEMLEKLFYAPYAVNILLVGVLLNLGSRTAVHECRFRVFTAQSANAVSDLFDVNP